MTLEEIRAKLRPYNLKRVAELTCLSHATVWRIVTGKTKNPSWAIVYALEVFLTEGK